MKKAAALILILLLLATPVYAASGGDQGKSDQASDGNNSAGGNGKAVSQGNGVSVQNKTVEKEQKTLHQQLQDRINLTYENETAGLENLSPAAQTAWKNQNAVRVAVHALLSLGEIDGGIGQNVSAIAREFNNSVRTRLSAEEQINQNTGLSRLFFGGDAGAAETILADLNATQEQIREMKRLIENCTCDNETQALLLEQIRVMEEEQERLRILAGDELSDKGLLGWIWK